MNKIFSRLPGGRWARWLAWALVGLLLLWGLAWLAMPPLLKWQLEKQATAALGRAVTVERVDFRPWSLELTVQGLRVAGAGGSSEQFSLARFYVNAELQSLFRLAPVLDAVALERPSLRVRHLGEGRYDIDDVLARLRPAEDQPPSDPLQFALFNIAVSGGDVVFEDDGAGVTHRLSGLTLGVPFLSNLPSRREVVTQPHLAFTLNGSAFDSSAATTPFARTRETDASVEIPALDLAPYLPYWPTAWPVKPEAGVLQLALKLDFEQQDTPRLSVSGTAALSGLRVAERRGTATSALLAWERLGVTLSRLEPLARRVDVAAIELKAPSVWMSRDAAGLLNLQRVAQGWRGVPASPSSSPAATPSAPPWTVSVDRLDMEEGTVHWADASVKPAADLALDELRVQAQAITWPVQTPVPFELSARLAKTPLSLRGTATDVEATAQLVVGELGLSAFAPYTADVLSPELDGRLAADLQLEWRAATADRPMGLKMNASRIELNEARLGPSRQPQASVRVLRAQDVRMDLAASTVEVGAVVINRPQVRAQRDKDGRWMVERWMKAPASGAASASPAPKAAEPSPWQLTLADVQVDAGSVAYEDLALSRPVRLDLSQIRLRARNLQPLAKSQPDMPVSLQLRMGESHGNRAEPGRLQLDGTLRLPGAGTRDADSLRTRMKVQADRLPVHALEPYFGDRLNLELLRADTSYRGTVDAALPPAGLRLGVAGNVSLDDFRANTLSPAEDLLAWKSLQVRGLQLAMAPGQVTRVSVEETVLSDYFARLIINETGRINLQGLVKHERQTDETAPAAPAAPAAASPAITASAIPDPDIRFGPISLVNGRVLFSDRFIKPNYSANLSELTGSLSAFASVPPGGASQMADLTLRGRAEGTAALEIDGKLNPLAQPLALDIQGRVRNLELPPLSPYTVKYAGYGIERGKLSMDVAYKIEPDGQLTASNQIILNQLSFGERVADSEAPNLPVKLAVALLADRNGVIDINLPVSGSLNDPQFKLAPLIFRLIFNLIGKAITSPFALIAGAFGGGGEEMNQVGFAPGSKVLDSEARQRLDAVAKALADRPALQLTVVGHGDLEAERSGYQRARLDERVLAEKRRLLAREGTAINESLTVSAAEYPALLKEVYRRADIPKPRNLIGMAKDIPQAEMEALLLASIPVSADAIRELAVTRGVVVKDYLATRQLAEDRMFLGAPQLGSQGGKWRPQAELRLAPR